ncbi:hypothetical protein NO2_1192 [Candidatus Termititenax persephonae]|uniref:Uncharacterized protein n=1 Tax=Candidatus Termititenax persephonae TaxID=2218525 RepID=A0A388TIP2_9BACT|nr:hypothetical protein NO2_1192 [Candidatus Termititenax persephonae]
MPADRKTVNFTYKTSAAVDRNANYLMEMLKFMPGYERKGFTSTDTSEDYEQYGKTAADGTPIFGKVAGLGKAYGNAYGMSGLQFTSDNAADFENLDGSTQEQPLNTWVGSVWAKIQGSLKNENRSYYEIMMDGADNLSPEQAFASLAVMLESRTRVNSAMTEIFGSPDENDAVRLATFNRWYDESGLATDPVKSGFFQFFMNANESFLSHILPMYGQSNEFVESTLDKTRLQNFLTSMKQKIAQYIGISEVQLDNPGSASQLSGDRRAAFEIWRAWLNPENSMPTADQNTGLKETDWGKQVYEKLQGEMDKIIHQNIAGRVAYRQRYEQYKKDKEEYEEKIEEEEKIELEQEKAAQKKRAEEKALLEKIAEQNRAAAKANTGQTQQAKPAAAPPPPAASAIPAPPPKQKSAPARQMQVSNQGTPKAPASPTAKAATKVAASKPVKLTTAAAPSRKITTASAPAKVVAKKAAATKASVPAAVASKPILRVRKGASPSVTSKKAVSRTAPAANTRPTTSVSVSKKSSLTKTSVRATGSISRRIKVGRARRRRSRRMFASKSVFK